MPSRPSRSAASASSSPDLATAERWRARARQLEATRRWRPEWPIAVAAATAWLTMLAGLGMHAAHAAPHHMPLAGLSELPGWSLMAVAMMVPITLPAVRYVGLNSMRQRQRRAMVLYTAVYVGVWMLFGITALGIDHLLRVHLGLSEPVVLALALAAAAIWQLTPAKRRALYACGKTVPLPPVGRRADRGCIRFALLQGQRCVVSCWALMLVMIAVGHANLLWMAALTALVFAEELTIRGRVLTRPAAGALAMAAAAVALGA